jgi:hypothetical protein
MSALKPVLFRCKTDNAYHMKMMAEIISNVLKNGFFEINSDGISMSMFDHPRKTMVSVNLQSENFITYVFNHHEPIYIGMNTLFFHEMLIKTIPREHNRIVTSSLRIQSSQNIDVSTPEGYTKSIIIPSNDFNKMIKDLNVIGSEKINITTSAGFIKFSANADGVVKRDIEFGEEIDSAPKNIKNFSTEQFERISKISSLSSSLHIYPCTDELPIKFKSMVGNLGTICIYIKSNEMIESENS